MYCSACYLLLNVYYFKINVSLIDLFYRFRKLFYQLYGTSSKPASSNLNSKLNFFSFLKNTSESILPAFWKSVNISSSILNHVFSSIKKSEKANSEIESLKSDSSDLQKPKSEAVNNFAKNSEVPPLATLPKKEADDDSSHLEQAFFDWLSGRSLKESRKEFLEKNDKDISKAKKTAISKVSNFVL